MSLPTLLRDLEGSGIRLHCQGERLRAEIPPGATLDPYRERIRRDKLAILALLHLQDEIVSAATAARDAFDRQYYDELWRRWHTLHEQEIASG